MAKQTKKSSPRLSAKAPGVLGFADGGKVETADELMARMTAKYGAPSAGPAQAAPVQQPAPQPQPKVQPQPQGQGGGIIGILKGRQQQIDKAVNGYANGGKIEGPGSPTSDSIDAQVSETGEPIKVSTKERIVSHEQGQFLEGVAKNAGFDSLDAMLEFGTGKPVGPMIRAGRRAAADGMAPSDDEQRIKVAIAAPPTLGGAPFSRSEPAGVLTGPASGITVDPFGPSSTLGSGLFGQDGANKNTQFMTGKTPGVAPEPFQKPGRDAGGIITADSAQAAAGSSMQRSGGISGSIDMAGVNGILARENKARGEMIDLSIAANGGNGIAILGGDGPSDTERANAEKTNRWALDDLRSGIKGAGSPTERQALSHALSQSIAGQNQQAAETIRQEGIARGQDLNYGARMAQQGLTARGQDLGLQRATERNEAITRGQDIRASTAADRTASNEAIAATRINERSGPTLSQQRGNAEIGAARERIAGLTPDEIKRKTANFTSTGRENPEYDPTLAKAVTLANRRMVGADEEFDQRQPPQQTAQQPKAATFTRDDVHAAISAGADRAKVIERIKSFGGNPADYGL